MVEERWYTTSDAARRLRMGVRGIRRLIRRGELKATWIGGSAGYRIKESDLEEFVRRRAGPSDMIDWARNDGKGSPAR